MEPNKAPEYGANVSRQPRKGTGSNILSKVLEATKDSQGKDLLGQEYKIYTGLKADKTKAFQFKQF